MQILHILKSCPRRAADHEGLLTEPEEDPRKQNRGGHDYEEHIPQLQPARINPTPRLHNDQLVRQVDRIRKDTQRSEH